MCETATTFATPRRPRSLASQAEEARQRDAQPSLPAKPAKLPAPVVPPTPPPPSSKPFSPAIKAEESSAVPPVAKSTPATPAAAQVPSALPKLGKQELANKAISDMLRPLSATFARGDSAVALDEFVKVFPGLCGKVIGQTPSVQGLSNTVIGFASRVVENLRVRLKTEIDAGHCPDPEFLKTLAAAYAAKFVVAKPAAPQVSVSGESAKPVAASTANQSSPSITAYLALLTSNAAESKGASIARWANDNRNYGGKSDLTNLLRIILPTQQVPSGIMQGADLIKLRTKVCSILATVLPRNQVFGRRVTTPLWLQNLQ